MTISLYDDDLIVFSRRDSSHDMVAGSKTLWRDMISN
jgi:hypothetical protein